VSSVAHAVATPRNDVRGVYSDKRFAALPEPSYPFRMTLVPDEFRARFERKGWYPGRQVPVGPRVPKDHPAHQALAELGGLCLTRTDGDDMTDYDNYFELVEFQYLEPDQEQTPPWERALNTRLVAIAAVDSQHGAMLMSSRGFIFGVSQIHHGFWLYGRSFAEALPKIYSVAFRAQHMVIDAHARLEFIHSSIGPVTDEPLGPESPKLQGA